MDNLKTQFIDSDNKARRVILKPFVVSSKNSKEQPYLNTPKSESVDKRKENLHKSASNHNLNRSFDQNRSKNNDIREKVYSKNKRNFNFNQSSNSNRSSSKNRNDNLNLNRNFNDKGNGFLNGYGNAHPRNRSNSTQRNRQDTSQFNNNNYKRNGVNNQNSQRSFNNQKNSKENSKTIKSCNVSNKLNYNCSEIRDFESIPIQKETLKFRDLLYNNILSNKCLKYSSNLSNEKIQDLLFFVKFKPFVVLENDKNLGFSLVSHKKYEEQ
ncbi:unnamed protein product [Brachionus calyciflorus]|uniref:Uncharacterized protein n=1 Tax=Brachionus calyciflorus TaxID=104777 RepID=A0A814R4F9_9BILA|nr:unnamed protein product [Brachionus calyciflorus]